MTRHFAANFDPENALKQFKQNAENINVLWDSLFNIQAYLLQIIVRGIPKNNTLMSYFVVLG